jgi:hypothetical protein
MIWTIHILEPVNKKNKNNNNNKNPCDLQLETMDEVTSVQSHMLIKRQSWDWHPGMIITTQHYPSCGWALQQELTSSQSYRAAFKMLCFFQFQPGDHN